MWSWVVLYLEVGKRHDFGKKSPLGEERVQRNLFLFSVKLQWLQEEALLGYIFLASSFWMKSCGYVNDRNGLHHFGTLKRRPGRLQRCQLNKKLQELTSSTIVKWKKEKSSLSSRLLLSHPNKKPFLTDKLAIV